MAEQHTFCPFFPQIVIVIVCMLLLTGALMTTIFETWHWAYILSSWLGFYSKSSIMRIGILRESQLEILTFSLCPTKKLHLKRDSSKDDSD